MTTPAPIRLCVGGTYGTLAVKEFADMAALAEYMRSAPYPKAPDNILADKEAKGNWKKWTLDCVTSVREEGSRNGLVAIHRNRTYSKEIGTQILIEDFDSITEAQAATLPDMAAQFGADCFVIDSPTTQDHLGIYKRKVFTLLDRVANEAEYLHIWKQRAEYWRVFGMTSDPAQSHSHQMCYRPGNGARVWARPGTPLDVPADCPPMPQRERLDLGEGGESEPLGDLLPALIERFRDGPPAPASGANGFDDVIRPVMFGLGADVLRASDLTDESRAELEAAVDHWLRDRDNIDDCWRAAENGNGETTRGTVLHLLDIRTAQALPEFGAQPVPASPVASRFAMGVPDDSDNLATEWVIPGFIPAALTVTSGPAGIGKTSGTEVLISQVADIRRQAALKPTPWRYVVYFTEDPKQLRTILSEANKDASVPWHDRICVVDTRRKSVADLTAELSEISGLYTRRASEAGTRIDMRPLVVIDTVAASFAMESINDNSEVSKFMAACKDSGLIVWLLTHSAKQLADKGAEDRGAIGAQSWAADAQHTMSWGFVDGSPDQRKLVAHKRRVEVKGELLFKSELRRVMRQCPFTGEMVEEFVRVSSVVGGEAAKSEPQRDEAPGPDPKTWPDWMPKLVDVAAWGRADGKRPDGKPKPKRLSANGEIALRCIQDALQATANHWAKFEWKPGVGMCDTALEEAFKPTLLEKLPREKDQLKMQEKIMQYLGKPDGLFTGGWRINPEAEIWLRGCHYRALMHRLAGG